VMISSVSRHIGASASCEYGRSGNEKDIEVLLKAGARRVNAPTVERSNGQATNRGVSGGNLVRCTTENPTPSPQAGG